MPILQIDIVGEEEQFRRDLAQLIADKVGEALHSREQGTWVRLEFVPPHLYAENGCRDERQQPVIASLIQSVNPEQHLLVHQIVAITGAIAEATQIPSENVHLIVEPAATGRVAFGGTLVE